MGKNKKKLKAQLSKLANEGTVKKEIIVKEKIEKVLSDVSITKKEIAKIILSILACAIILAGFAVLDLKTDYMNQFADWVGRFLHLGN